MTPADGTGSVGGRLAELDWLLTDDGSARHAAVAVLRVGEEGNVWHSRRALSVSLVQRLGNVDEVISAISASVSLGEGICSGKEKRVHNLGYRS